MRLLNTVLQVCAYSHVLLTSLCTLPVPADDVSQPQALAQAHAMGGTSGVHVGHSTRDGHGMDGPNLHTHAWAASACTYVSVCMCPMGLCGSAARHMVHGSAAWATGHGPYYEGSAGMMTLSSGGDFMSTASLMMAPYARPGFARPGGEIKHTYMYMRMYSRCKTS